VSDREQRSDGGHVPDHVLDELTVAFSRADEPPEKGYDFDDPSIDRLLGLPVQGDDEGAADDGSDDEFEDDNDNDDFDFDEDVEGVDGPQGAQGAQGATAIARANAAAARTTIVIAEDELPDTVYLDDGRDEHLDGVERLRRDGDEARSTVVIGDLDDGTTVHQLAPAGSSGTGSMDPRIRARRIANRRAEGRRRLVWVAVVGAAVLVVVGAIAVVASPIFDVTNVRVQGAVYTDADVLKEVVGSLRGHPVLLVDTRKAEARLREVPWVDQAKVSTAFPHTVTIDIRERRPLAAFQSGDGQWRVIDVDGRVLDLLAGQPDAYVLITGKNPDTSRGQYAGAPYASAASLVVAMPGEIRTLVASIGLDSATGTLSMQLKNGAKKPIEVRLGDTSGLDDKLARLLSQVRKGLAGVCSLDVATSEVGVVPGC
jgi:cell division protein FtsQ